MQKLSSLPSPTRDGLGTRRKRSECHVGRENGKPSVLQIYIMTLKARIAGGPCQYGEGRTREALVFLCQLPVLKMAASSRACLLYSWSLVVFFRDLNMMARTATLL